MNGPLEGVRVIELGRYIAAPYAATQLADLGADVIKVEDPGHGDPMRRWQGGDRPYSPQFAAYNRGKRGVTVDLRGEQGRRVMAALLSEADVLIENFRPGVTARLGISPEDTMATYPRLIHASITGFGHNGPYSQRPSFDTIISAYSGLYSQLFDPSAPRPVGPAFSDLLAGLFAVQAILAALHERESSGRGQHLDSSMLAAAIGFLAEPALNVLDTGEVTHANTRQRRAQSYGVLDRDGRPFVVHLSVPEKFWIGLTEVIGQPELRDDPRFATRQGRYDNYAELDLVLRDAMVAKTREEWFRMLEAHDVPHAPVNDMGEVFEDEQVQFMDLVREVPVPGWEPMRSPRPPVRFSRTDADLTRSAPLLGQHNEALAAALDLPAAWFRTQDEEPA